MQEDIELSDGDVDDVVRSVAGECGFYQVEIVRFHGSIDLMDELAPAGGHILDLVVMPHELPDSSALQTLFECRDRLPLLYSIVIGENAEQAAQASMASVEGFLLRPTSADRFAEELKRQFKSLARLHRASFVMISTEGEHRIPFHSVLYCETSGHDQVVHLETGASLVGRYSSQALFDMLDSDDRFFKVGSSFIVNLNEVLEVNTPNGILLLSDGTELSVPHRIRKSLEQTLLEWH